MPALVMFKRKWQLIGSDDFVLPAICSASIRLLVVVAAVIVYITEHSFHECPTGSILMVFMIGLVILLSVTIILEFTIAIISAKGTVLNAVPRKNLPLVLYVRLFILLVELIWSGVGAYWVFPEWSRERDNRCDIKLVELVKTFFCCFWVLICSFFVLVCLLFGTSIKQEEELRGLSSGQIARHLKAIAKSTWEKRLRWLSFFFCVSRDDNFEAASAELAESLADFFGTLDIVPTDVAAGLVLLQLEQQRRICKGEPLGYRFTLLSDSLLPTIPVTEVLDPVIYYFKYACAILGWPGFIEKSICCGACKLIPAVCTHFCCPRRSFSGRVNDNCCHSNAAAAIKDLGIDEDDVIYLSFHDKIYQIPFMVVIDKERKSIVVALRGSLSLEDMFTCSTIEAKPVNIPGHPDIYGHGGMVNSAMFVLGKIKELCLLEQAVARHPDYNIILTGFSLGAGTAILLSVLLKDEWPGLKCYAYAPPFAVLSAEGVHFTKDFVISVVFGLDLICRASFHIVNDLKDQVMEVLQHSPAPKYRILLGGWWYSLCGLLKLLPDGDLKSPLLGSPIKHNNKTGDCQTAEAGKASSDPHQISYAERDGTTLSATSISPIPSEIRMKIELYPGGSLLWIREADQGSSKRWFSTSSGFSVQWATYKEFDHILISVNMMLHHRPLFLRKALRWLKDNMGQEMEITPVQVDTQSLGAEH